MSPTSAVRAFTLLEALVAAGLLGLLLLVMAAVIVPVFRHSTKGSAQMHAQQLALLAAERLDADLNSTSLNGVQWLTQPGPPREQFLTVQPIEATDPDGEPVWSRDLIVYRWSHDERRLDRRVYSLGAGATVDRPTHKSLAEVGALWQQPPREARAVAGNLTPLLVYGGDDPALPPDRQPVTIAVSCELSPAPVYSTLRRVFLHNPKR